MDYLAEAIKLVGSQSALARAFGLRPQAVQQWAAAPPDKVLKISEATGWRVSPHQLRPDLYPHPDDGLPSDRRGAPTPHPDETAREAA